MAEFICGVMAGAMLGVVVMALVCAGARADECAKCQERQNRERVADNTKGTITFIPDKGTGTIFGRFVPCRRDVDGVIGLWDTMENCFCETPGATSTLNRKGGCQ